MAAPYRRPREGRPRRSIRCPETGPCKETSRSSSIPSRTTPRRSSRRCFTDVLGRNAIRRSLREFRSSAPLVAIWPRRSRQLRVQSTPYLAAIETGSLRVWYFLLLRQRVGTDASPEGRSRLTTSWPGRIPDGDGAGLCASRVTVFFGTDLPPLTAVASSRPAKQ